MFVGNFNYHQILFTLDTFKLSSEKLTYLNEISAELNRIIDCFESPKNYPLKMYASKDLNIDENCKELQDFISKQYNFTNLNNHRRIYPGESALKGLLRKELINYKKLSSLVDMEIMQISKPIWEQNIVRQETANKNNFIIPLKTTPKYIVSLLTNNNGKIIWSKSIGELIDLMKIIMVLELYPEVDEKQIVNLICTRFVNINHENYSYNQVAKTKETLENIFWQNGRTTTPKITIN